MKFRKLFKQIMAGVHITKEQRGAALQAYARKLRNTEEERVHASSAVFAGNRALTGKVRKSDIGAGVPGIDRPSRFRLHIESPKYAGRDGQPGLLTRIGTAKEQLRIVDTYFRDGKFPPKPEADVVPPAATA